MKLFNNKIFSRSFSVPFVEVLSKGISFINILLLIQLLTIEEYAVYSYIIAIVLWSSVLMDGGITNLIYNKSIKKDINNVNVLFSARLILSFFIIFFLVVIFSIKKPELVRILLIISFVIVFSSASSLIKMFARGNGYSDVDLITIITEPLIRLVFLLILYFSVDFINWEFYQVLLFYLLAGFIALLINYYKLSKYFRLKIIITDLNSLLLPVKQTLKESKYYLLYYLMIVGIGRIDIIYIEKFANKTDLALFSSALNIYQVSQLFFFAVITSQFLILIKNRSYIIKYLMPVLIIVIVIVIFISRYFYLYLFPEEYFNGYIVLNYIVLALFPSVLNYYFITRNNYNDQVKANFFILFIFLMIKIGIYQFLKSADLSTYYTIFPLIEAGILITYLMFMKFYESSPDQ